MVIAVTTLVGGVISVLSIVVRLHPALENVKHLKDSVDLYSHYIRTPLMRLLPHVAGVELAGFLAGTVIDLLVFWLMFFVAVNVFVYKYEHNFLPGHISRSYCQLAPRNIVARAVCVTPKLLAAFLAAPIVCTVYALTRFHAAPHELHSAAYLTIQPRMIFSYLLALFGAISLVLIASGYALRSYG
jgi:hypothetical protein